MTKHLTPRPGLPAVARTIKKLALLLAVISAGCAGAATAHAQNARTWVSATGTDTSNTQCSVNAPCLTFAHAIGQTAGGGEIDCLTPGGFGAVTISMPVTINCEGTSNGGISVSSGAAITISTPNIVVNLIGLDINGLDQSATSGPGVNITAAANVTIRNCKIYGFTGSEGIAVSAGTLIIDGTYIANNTYGIIETSQVGALNLTMHNSTVVNNTYGISVGVATGTHAGATIEQTTLAFNSYGIYMSGSAGVVLIGGSTLVNNGTGVFTGFGGTVYSFLNNQIGGNGTDGTPLTAYPGGLN